MGLVRAAAGTVSTPDDRLWPNQPTAERYVPLQHFRHSILAGFQLWEPTSGEDFWTQWGLAVFLGIGALAIAIIVGVVYTVLKHRDVPAKDTRTQQSAEQVSDPQAEEPQHVRDPEAAEPEATQPGNSHTSTKQKRNLKHSGTMVQAKDEIVALVSLAQRVGTFVGPKLLKSQAVKSVLSKRLGGARARAENMLMNEVNGMAAEVCEIIDAPEVMLLKDWEATTTSFPPLPGLVSGLIAPLRLQSNLGSNLVHIIGILPIVGLCGWALYNDWALGCNPIPSLRWWVVATLWVGGVLIIARTMLLTKVRKGLQTLQSKANETHLRSELRLAEYDGSDLAGELHLREIKELLIDHSVLASHALKVDASINASIWNPIVGITTVLWVGCILWNLWEAIRFSFVPGRVAFHDAAQGHENFCASWHIVMVGRIVAVLSVLLLLFNLFAILMWVLGFVMQSDELASRIHEATRRFDRNTTGLPVAQLLVRLCIMPSAELEEVRIHHVRQKYLAAEEDLRRTQKNMEHLTKRRDKQAAKLQKLEAIAVEKAKSGKNKDPLDQTLEEIEQAIRSSFDMEAWHAQGLDAVRKAKESCSEEEDPQHPADSFDKLVTDLGNLASRVQESQEFHKATEAAQSAASFGTEKMQEVIAQAQQVDTEELAQASKKMLEQATEKGKLAMEQAQQSQAFQKAQTAIGQAQQSGTFQIAQSAASAAQSAASAAMEQAQGAATAAAAKTSQASSSDSGKGDGKKGDSTKSTSL